MKDMKTKEGFPVFPLSPSPLHFLCPITYLLPTAIAMQKFLLSFLLISLLSCSSTQVAEAPPEAKPMPFLWENATVYFMLTDRFNNGDSSNDQTMGRQADGAVLRSFMGGDFQGITQKIEEGYFDDLGVNALWFTPPVEQISSHTDEGTGKTYAYHGYWARDWTAIDPNFGSMEDLKALVKTAHEHGIRIMWDAVINHTGPVTEADPVWPSEWVRTEPACDFTGFDGTVHCTLVKNLPDTRTGAEEEEVELPEFLVEKWKAEGRYEQEVAELDEFFAATGHPRTPRYYLIKWLCDWIRELGIDAFRVDTAKHTEADVWADLKKEAIKALKEWKAANPGLQVDELDFFMTGEVYNYFMEGGREFDYGDTLVDFYDNGFESLINFGLKQAANGEYEEVFTTYSNALNGGNLDGLSLLNYMTSHDDGQPFDLKRERVMRAATFLLLTPGSAQIYYGDETARPLEVEGAVGDANLRSFMNWEELEQNVERNGLTISDALAYYQKLGRFRQEHLSVGAGVHEMISEKPYLFKRSLNRDGFEDQVVVGLDLKNGSHTIEVAGIFADGTELKDYFSGKTATVTDGKVSFEVLDGILLVGKPFEG